MTQSQWREIVLRLGKRSGILLVALAVIVAVGNALDMPDWVATLAFLGLYGGLAASALPYTRGIVKFVSDRPRGSLAFVFTTVGVGSTVLSATVSSQSWWSSFLLEFGVGLMFIGVVDFLVEVELERRESRGPG